MKEPCSTASLSLSMKRNTQKVRALKPPWAQRNRSFKPSLLNATQPTLHPLTQLLLPTTTFGTSKAPPSTNLCTLPTLPIFWPASDSHTTLSIPQSALSKSRTSWVRSTSQWRTTRAMKVQTLSLPISSQFTTLHRSWALSLRTVFTTATYSQPVFRKSHSKESLNSPILKISTPPFCSTCSPSRWA